MVSSEFLTFQLGCEILKIVNGFKVTKDTYTNFEE